MGSTTAEQSSPAPIVIHVEDDDDIVEIVKDVLADDGWGTHHYPSALDTLRAIDAIAERRAQAAKQIGERILFILDLRLQALDEATLGEITQQYPYISSDPFLMQLLKLDPANKTTTNFAHTVLVAEHATRALGRDAVSFLVLSAELGQFRPETTFKDPSSLQMAIMPKPFDLDSLVTTSRQLIAPDQPDNTVLQIQTDQPS